MTVTLSVVVALMVLFGASLIGKMLKDIFPGSVFAYLKGDKGQTTHPAE